MIGFTRFRSENYGRRKNLTCGLQLRSLFVCVAVLVVGWGGRCGTAQAAEDGKEELIVKDIRVIGLQTIGINAIKANMGTRVGKPLHNGTLDDDFQRISKMPEIADVQIEKEEKDGGIRLLVLVREKPFVRRIVFRGNKKTKSKKLRDLLTTKIGGRYDKGMVNEDVRTIEDKYRKDFYYFGKVTPSIEPYEDGVRVIFTVQEGGKLTIKKIIIRGNYNITTKALKKIMATKENSLFGRGKYTREEFEKDIERLRRFYQSKGYQDAEVTERPFKIIEKGSTRKALVYIDVNEGEQYRVGRVDFKGNSLVSDTDLRNVIKTKPGDVYSPEVAQKDARRIRDIYGKAPSSRYFTRVHPSPQLTEEGPIMDVKFVISEGEPVVVEDVRVLGLTKTKQIVALREIEVLPGKKLDSDNVNASLRNLKNLGIFDPDVRFNIKRGSAPDRAVAVAELKETSTGRLQLGAGLSTTESFIGTVQLSQRNFDYKDWPDSLKKFLTGQGFIGGGQNFRANFSAGSLSENYLLSFNNPWIFNKPISFGFSAGFRSFRFRRYDEERLHASLSLGKRLFGNKYFTGRMTYRIENVKLTNFDGDVSPELMKEEGASVISRAIFNLTYDTRNNRFDPTEGFLLSGTQELAGTVLGGDRDFWRSFMEVDFFHPIYHDKKNRPWVLRLHGKFSAAEEIGGDNYVPIFERLYAGGVGSMRGFRYRTISPRDSNGDEIGGKLLLTGTAEFFVPIYERLVRASVFYDIGSVSGQFGSFNSDLWRTSVGIGLHVQTPLSAVPIRLYWANVLNDVEGDDQQTFQFTLGLLF